jgi:hypothetical protein
MQLKLRHRLPNTNSRGTDPVRFRALRFSKATNSYTAVALAHSISKNTAVVVVDVHLPATFPISTPTLLMSILSLIRQLVSRCNLMDPMLPTPRLHSTLLSSRACIRTLVIPGLHITQMAISHVETLARLTDVELVPQE